METFKGVGGETSKMWMSNFLEMSEVEMVPQLDQRGRLLTHPTLL